MISRLPDGPQRPWKLNPACPHCSGVDGIIVKRGDQNTLFCASCQTYQGRNVPKAELGEPQRKVSTRDGLKPSQRARVLESCGFRCQSCGASAAAGAILHVGHMLSVEDATNLRNQGLPVTEDLLNDDLNLFAVCESCNLGQRGRSITLRLAYFILRANVERAKGRFH